MRGSSRFGSGELLLACSLLASNPGCSYALVHGPLAPTETPPATGQPAPASCTSSNAVPTVDTILAVPFIAAGGFAVVGATQVDKGCTIDCGSWGTPAEWAAVGAGLIAIGTLFISSAVTGYGRTADCRRTEEALPTGPHPSERYLLDVRGIAEARTRSQ